MAKHNSVAGPTAHSWLNNQSPDSKWNLDKGCSNASLFCLYINDNQPGVNFEGDQCVAAVGGLTPPTPPRRQPEITSTKAATLQRATPHCADTSGEEVQVWNGAGDHCAFCVNNDCVDGNKLEQKWEVYHLDLLYVPPINLVG
jgi:hypothetical protein